MDDYLEGADSQCPGSNQDSFGGQAHASLGGFYLRNCLSNAKEVLEWVGDKNSSTERVLAGSTGYLMKTFSTFRDRW